MTKAKALQTIYAPSDDMSWSEYQEREESHERAILALLGDL